MLLHYLAQKCSLVRLARKGKGTEGQEDVTEIKQQLLKCAWGTDPGLGEIAILQAYVNDRAMGKMPGAEWLEVGDLAEFDPVVST